MATFKPQNDKPAQNSTESSNNRQPGDAIITLFGPEIQLDELSIFDHTTSGEGTEEQKAEEAANSEQKVEDEFSIRYPLIQVNDYQFSKEEIKSLVIDCTSRVPRVVLRVSTSASKFADSELPKDSDILSIMIRPTNDVLKPLRNDYIIEDVRIKQDYNLSKPSLRTDYDVVITGTLFIPQFHNQKFKFAHIGTSYECVQKIAKQAGLGFATNESATDDKQLWISTNSGPISVIDNIVKHSWANDKSFFDWWIDIYYNFNFVNVNKMLMKKEEIIDVGAYLTGLNTGFRDKLDPSEDKGSCGIKIFTNIGATSSSPYYFSKYDVVNDSADITRIVGTRNKVRLIEYNDTLFRSGGNIYSEVVVNPIYDETKLKTHMVLRGRIKSTPENTVEGVPQKANIDTIEMFTKYPWMGVQYTASDTTENDVSKWNGNVHKFYTIAQVHNNVNLRELDKLNVKFTVAGINFDVYRGDKLPVYVQDGDDLRVGQTKQETINVDKELKYVNRMYSGWYLLKDFVIKFDPDDEKVKNSVNNKYVQTFTVTRREWPTPQMVVEDDTKELGSDAFDSGLGKEII